MFNANLNSGVSFNKFVSQIKSNATWDNRQVPINGFSNLDYTLEFGPSLEKVVSKPLATTSEGTVCGFEYYTSDLGWKPRCIFGMNGNGKIICESDMGTAITNLKTFANTQFSNYCPNIRGTLDKYVISTGINTIGFNFSWSSESEKNVVIPQSNYSSVDTLSLK